MKKIYAVLVIGVGPAGLFATFYAGVRQLNVALLEADSRLGGRIRLFQEQLPLLNTVETGIVPKMPMLFFHLLLKKTIYSLNSGDLIEYAVGSLKPLVPLFRPSTATIV